MNATRVFLSYRRKDSTGAEAVYRWLREQGFDVFMDVQSLGSGSFERVILEQILAREHFVVLLRPDSLDRADQPGDWLRREIETAMTHRRNVVPLTDGGFSFEALGVKHKLTGQLARLKEYTAVEIPAGYFPAAMERLVRFLSIDFKTVVHPESPSAKKAATKQLLAADKSARFSPRNRSFLQHLDPKVGPKSILAIDGGGSSSALSLGVLRRLEDTLREQADGHPDFRLSDAFDLIVGTSTGAIIAAGLALGWTVDEVATAFAKLGARAFGVNRRTQAKQRASSPGTRPDRLSTVLKGIFGERRLGDGDFRTALLMLIKRIDTGAVWPISNNPSGKYFRPRTSGTAVPVVEYLLWQVLRASIGAPVESPPVTIPIGKADVARGLRPVHGEYIDAVASPHKNPSLFALMFATLDGYQLKWPTGAEQLRVVSIGSGRKRRSLADSSAPAYGAVAALASVLDDCDDHVETMLQWLSESPTARSIDREIGLAQPPLGGMPLVRYLRYDVYLEADWLQQNLAVRMDNSTRRKLVTPKSPADLQELERIGRLAGAHLVRRDHFS